MRETQQPISIFSALGFRESRDESLPEDRNAAPGESEREVDRLALAGKRLKEKILAASSSASATKCKPDSRGTTRPLQQKRGSCRGTDPRSGKCPAAAHKTIVLAGRYWADFCSGSGVVTKALRRLGVAAREWERSHGEWGDITQRSSLRTVRSDASSGRCLGCCLAPPCGTFSTSLFWTGLLRSAAEPWGLSSGLTDAQRKKVDAANLVVRAVLWLIGIFHRLRLPWICENPKSSLLWLLTQFVV